MRKVSDLLLERYLLDELPPADKAVLAQRLAADPALRSRLDDLRSAHEEFARTRDAGSFARTLRERLRRDRIHAGVRARAETPQGGSRLAGWKPALGGVFLLALVAVPAWRVLNGESSLVTSGAGIHPGVSPDVPETSLPAPDATGGAATSAPNIAKTETTTPPGATRTDTGGEPGARTKAASAAAPADVRPPSANPPALARVDEESTRLKGRKDVQPTLALFRRTGAGAEPLKPGAPVRPGDVLRIGYRAAGRPFGAIFSVDGLGNVTRHWPLTGDRAARLGGGETLLPGAFELDDAPSYERFYLLVAEHEFDLKPLLESLHASRVPAEDGVDVIRFDLLKENGI